MSTEWTEEAIRNTLANLPESARAMLAELDYTAEAWFNANRRTRSLVVAYGIPLRTAKEMDRQMTEAMGRKLDTAVFQGTDLWAEEREAQAELDRLRGEMDHLAARIIASLAGPTGAADMPPGLPPVVHGTVLDGGEAPEPQPPTREQGPEGSDVTHLATPAQRRTAWLAHHAHLVAVQEDALRRSRDMLRHVPRSEEGQASWLAEEWAALQLLKVLRDMKAPEVPVDDTLGQATLEEVLDPVGCPYPLDDDGGCSHHHDDVCQPWRD